MTDQTNPNELTKQGIALFKAGKKQEAAKLLFQATKPTPTIKLLGSGLLV